MMSSYMGGALKSELSWRHRCRERCSCSCCRRMSVSTASATRCVHHPSTSEDECEAAEPEGVRGHAREPWVMRRTRATVERFMMDGHCSAAVEDMVAPTTVTCRHAEAPGAAAPLSTGRVATVR
jgi:hypothetical protein